MPEIYSHPGSEPSLESCIFSDAMMGVILSLSEDAVTCEEIERASGLGPEEIKSCLETLNQKWLIETGNKGYQFSQSGTILVLKMACFIKAIEAFSCALNASNAGKSRDVIYPKSSPLHYFLANRREIAALITHCSFIESLSARTDHGHRCGIICNEERIGIELENPRAERLTGRFSTDGKTNYSDDALYDLCSRYFDVLLTIRTLEKFVEFFETHSLEGIPEFAIDKIGVLISAELICDVPLDFTDGLDFFLQILRNANHIHGVSSFAKQNVADMLGEKVLEGTEVDLVVTPDVIRELFSHPYREKAMQLQHYPNLIFRVSKVPIHVGLTVTDKCLSFGLFTKGGITYDSIYDLVCGSPEALEWGETLFHYYKEHSVTLDEYLRDPVNLLKILNPFHLKKKKL